MPTFAHIVSLERRIADLLPPRPLSGPVPDALHSAAREWSDAVWAAARALGPLPMSDAEREEGLDLAGRAVCVCGAHRSGTTLVRDLLDGHPALAVLPAEGTFYTNHERHLASLAPADAEAFMATEWIRRLANPINQPPYWTRGASTTDASPYVGFARAVRAWWPAARARAGHVPAWPLVAIALAWASDGERARPRTGVRRWVEKTPTNEQHLDRLLGEFAGVRVIHVVRDPLDVLASRKRLEQRATGGFANLHAVLRDLGESYRIAVECSTRGDAGRYLLVRYEDLVAWPDRLADRLARFLDVATLPSLRQPSVGGQPVAPNSSFDRAADTGTIARVGVHAHADTLTADERLRLAIAVGDAAAALGYAVPA